MKKKLIAEKSDFLIHKVNRITDLKFMNKILLSLLCFLFLLLFMPGKAMAGTSTGTFISQVKDITGIVPVATISWTATTPTSTTVTMEFRAGNAATPDDTWQAWAAVTNGATLSAFSGKRYYQYRATLTSTDDDNNVPTLDSVTVTNTGYMSPATLGGSGASEVGLRADAGSGVKAKWAGVTYALSGALSANQAIKFAVRTSDDASTWSALKGNDGNDIDWTTGTGNYLGKAASDASARETLTGITGTRYLELVVRLESSGADTPTLNLATLTYDALEAPANGSTTMYKSDGSTQLKDTSGNNIVAGAGSGYANESSIKITTAGLTCTDCGTSTTRKIEVEAKPIASSFDGTGTVLGDYNDTTFASTASITGLSVGTSYHIRLRATDGQGRVSGWTNYASDATAFSVEQTAPTVASFSVKDASTGSTSYVGASKLITVTGTFNDTGGSSGTLQVQFSEDGTNWGAYSGSGTTNNKSTDWTNYTTITASETPQDPEITNAWALEGTDGAKTIYVRTRDAAGNVGTTSSAVETTDADFTAGTDDNTWVNSNSVKMLKRAGATASSGTECSSGTVSGGVCVNNWIQGVSSTVLEGKSVYNVDVSSAKQWKTDTTACVGPQCATGLDPSYPSNYSLIADNTNDIFSEYPARNECKSLGGRLPNYSELSAIYTDKVAYGSNFGTDYYWSATESTSQRSWIKVLATGTLNDGPKTNLYNVRCVKDSIGTNRDDGAFTSQVIDLTASKQLANIYWGETLASGTSITMQVKAVNDGNGNGAADEIAAASWTDVTKGADITSFGSKRYVQYKATLNGETSSPYGVPSLDDVTILYATPDTITLDSAGPTAFDVASPADNNWQSVASPTLSWNETSDGNGLDKYQLYINDELNKDSISTTCTEGVCSTTPTSPLTAGTYDWYIKAVDTAGNSTQSTSTRTVNIDLAVPNVSGLTLGTAAPALNSQTSINVTSTGSATDDGEIAGYRIFKKQVSNQSPNTPVLTAGAGTNLTAGAYKYIIVGYNSDNFEIEATTESSITTVTDTQHIGITWSAMTNATGYKVYRTAVGGATLSETLLKDVGNVTAYTDDGTDTLTATDIAIKPQYQYVGNSATLPTVASPYTVSSLTSGQTYSFYIKAYDQTGRYSTYSNEPSRSTVDTVSPQAPSSLVVTPTIAGDSLDLSWSGGFDGAGVTKYRIYMATASLGTYSAMTSFDVDITSTIDDTGTTREQTVTGLVDNKTYYFRVTALDASSNESTATPMAPTAGEEGTPPDITAPQFLQGAGLTATPASAYTMNLSWNNASDYSSDEVTEGTAQDGGSFTGWYKVYRDTAVDGTFATSAGGTCASTTSTSCTDSGLNALTTYYYKVKAVDKAGSVTEVDDAGNYSSAKLPATSIPSATTYTDQVPTSTTSNSVTATTTGGSTGSEVKVSFTGAASSTYENGSQARTEGTGVAIDYYRIYRFPAGTTITSPATTNGAVIESTVTSWASGLTGTLVKNTTYDGGTIGADGNISAASEAAQLADETNQRGDYYYEYIDNTNYANVVDSGLNDGTTYQYVVVAFDKEKPWLVDGGSQNARFATKASTITVTTPDTTTSTDPVSVSVETIEGIESSMPRLVVSWIIPAQVTRATTATVSSLSSTNGTSLVVSGGTGAQFAVGQFIKIDSEIIKITAIVTDTLTVTRAQGGSTAATHSAEAAISILDFSAYKLYKNSGLGYEEITSQTFESLNENYFVDSDIEEGEVYTYKVTVVDDAGRFKGYVANQQNQVVNSGVNNESTGVTVSYDPSADLVAPLITYTHQALSNGIGYSVTPSSATISWTTDENSSSWIDYGTTNTLGSTYGYSTGVTYHEVTVPELLPSTTYYFKIRSADGSDNLTTKEDTGSIPFTLATTEDTTNPVNPTTTSAWNANSKDTTLTSGNWYNYATPRFEWSGATDTESDVFGYLVYFGTSATGTPAAYQAEASPNYYPASSLVSGSTYYLRVKTRDAATNDSTANTLFTYKYDATAPTSNVASPSNGANLGSITTVSGTATDSYSNVGSVQISVKRDSDNYYLNSSNAFVDNSGTPIYLDATGAGSFTYNVSGATFSDGTYTITSKATDSVGNAETPSTSTAFRIDTTSPPQVDLVTPVNIQNLSSANPTFTFNATEEDSGSGLSYFELYVDGALNTDNPERIPVTANPIKKKIITPLTEGSHTWYVKAYDKVGNSSTSESTLSVNIDLTKPSSSITSPTTYQYLNDATLNITGTATKSASSSAAVDSVYVSVTKRGTGLSWVSATSLTGSGDTKDWSYTWTLPSNDDGEYFIISKAIDTAGNEENYGAGMTVAVDMTDPVISNIDVTDIGTTTANINFETSEATTAVIDYGLTESYGEEFAITGTNTKHTGRLIGLTEGENYNYQVTVTDSAGNITTSANSTIDMVGLDHDDPVISSVETSNISTTSATVSWTTDEVATSQVQYSLSSEFTSPVSVPETVDETKLNKTHRVDLTGLTSNTTYYFKVKSKDESDNEGESAGNDSLTTLKVPTVSPVGIQVTENANDKSITVAWTSNEITTSVVDYALSTGFTGAYEKSAVGDKASLTTSHSVIITDFTPLATYKFRVGGTNAQGVSAFETATPDTFDTDFVDNVAPTITFANQSLGGLSVQSHGSGIQTGVSSAVVKWDTDEAADSFIEYKKQTDSEYRSSAGDPKLLETDHTVTLKSLTPSTPYLFKIKSRDNAGNLATSSEYTFTTLSLGISDPKVATTATSAVITWTTNIDSSSQVEYQKQNSNAESKIEGDSTLEKSHSVTVKNLSVGRFSYKVKSIDADKNIAESILLTFEIPAVDSGTISTPEAGKIEEKEITSTTAKITWRTTVATTSWVEYGTASKAYTMLAGDNGFNTNHLVELRNLVPGTTYYYRVKGKDLNEVEYISQEYTITAVLKPEITNIKVSEITPYSALVSFDTNVETTVFVALGKDTNYGGGVGKNEFKRNHSILLDDLEDQSTYHYQISVKDKLGNEAKSADATVITPLDTTGPVVKEVKIDLLPMGTDDETASAIISWTTDKPSTTQIEYDEGIVGNNYSQFTVPDTSLNRAHTVIVKDLIPGTTYRFRVIAKDKKENLTKSQSYNFVTPTKEKSILQLIIRSLEETFSWVKDVGGKFNETRDKIFGG